jgi:hypothetical protein
MRRKCCACVSPLGLSEQIAYVVIVRRSGVAGFEFRVRVHLAEQSHFFSGGLFRKAMISDHRGPLHAVGAIEWASCVNVKVSHRLAFLRHTGRL